MKTFKVVLVDGRVFYISSYTRGEAVLRFEEKTGVSREEMTRVARVPAFYGAEPEPEPVIN